MSNIAEFARVPDVTIFPDSIESFLQKIVGSVEAALGYQLPLADPIRLICNGFALVMYQSIQLAERDIKTQFLKYSYGDFLDNLAANYGLFREDAKRARCKLRFFAADLSESAITIPLGTRVRTEDDITFLTDEYAEIPPLTAYVDVDASALDAGTDGNFIKQGLISYFIDKPPFIKAVENITQSTGGDDRESDDRLTYRCLMSWVRFTTAGSRQSYEYWTRQYNSSIGTVCVMGPEDIDYIDPGEVYIFVILSDGSPPDEDFRNGLLAYLNAEKIRPLGDRVVIGMPLLVYFKIDLKYRIRTQDAAMVSKIREDVDKAVDAYMDWQCVLGRDVEPAELIKRVREAGAKHIELNGQLFYYAKTPGNTMAWFEPKNVVYAGLEDD